MRTSLDGCLSRSRLMWGKSRTQLEIHTRRAGVAECGRGAQPIADITATIFTLWTTR